MNVKVKILDNNAKLPVYSTPGSACMDVTCTSIEYMKDIDTYVFHTGLAFEIPENHVMLIFPRSSNRKTDFYMPNSVGVLDSDYRGELMILFKERNGYFVENSAIIFKQLISKLYNNFKTYNELDIIDIENAVEVNFPKLEINNNDNRILTKDCCEKSNPYKVGDKIAQIMIIPYPKIEFEIVNKLSATKRGEGGFGSTGR